MSRAPLDLKTLRFLNSYAADGDRANDSGRCKSGVVSLIGELKGRIDELQDVELRRAIAETLDAASVFLWDDTHVYHPLAVQVSEFADALVPGIVSAEHKAHLGRR